VGRGRTPTGALLVSRDRLATEDASVHHGPILAGAGADQ
jgi:hypothetical protein